MVIIWAYYNKQLLLIVNLMAFFSAKGEGVEQPLGPISPPTDYNCLQRAPSNDAAAQEPSVHSSDSMKANETTIALLLSEIGDATFDKEVYLPLCYCDPRMETAYLTYNKRYFMNMDYVYLLMSLLMLASLAYLSHDPIIIVPCIVVSVIFLCASAVEIFAQYKHSTTELTALQRAAIIHEWFVAISLLLIGAALSFEIYPFLSTCIDDGRFVGPGTNSQNYNVCVRSVPAYPHLALAAPVFTGRPRTFFGIVCAIVFVALRNVSRPINPIDSSKDMGLKLVMDIGVATLLIVCQGALEWTYRASFEECVNAHRAKQRAMTQKATTDGYLSYLLPPSYYSRLLSREHYSDSGVVSVFVASVEDLAVWFPQTATQEDVRSALSQMLAFMSSLDKECTYFHVERIRVTGDEFVATSNLMLPTLCHAIRIASFAATVRSFVNEHRTRVRCAIHTGAMTGTVTGERYLRYDVSGEAMDYVTRELLPICPVGETVVSQAMKEVINDRAILVPLEGGVSSRSECNGGSTTSFWCLLDVSRTRVKPPLASAGGDCRPRCENSLEEMPEPVATHISRVHFKNEGATNSEERSELHEPPPNDPQASSPAVEEKNEVISEITVESQRYATPSKITLRFADADAESGFDAWQSSQHYHSVATFVELAFVGLIVIVQLIDFKGVSSGAALAGHCLGFGALFVTAGKALWVKRGRSVPAMQNAVLFGVETSLLSFGAALTRPSLVSNNLTFMLVMFLCTTRISNITNYSWMWCSVYVVIVLFVPQVIATFIRNGVQRVVALPFMIAFVSLVLVALRWSEVFKRQRYRDSQLMLYTSAIETKARDLLQHALAAVIPMPLMAQVAARYDTRMLDACVEPCNGVAVCLVFLPLVSLSSPRSTSSDEKGNGPDDGHAACLSVKRSMASAEMALREFQHLHLTKIAGNTILAAGPVACGSIRGAAEEALCLLNTVRGQCTAAVTVGSFYAVVTGGTWQPSFFLFGEAVVEAKTICAAAPNPSATFSDTFQKQFPFLQFPK